MEKIELKVAEAQGVITILEGTALPAREPKIVTLAGIISTPADFEEKRRETIDTLCANVVADYTNRTITFSIDEKNYYSTTVTGKLELFPELKSLNINAPNTYEEKELMKKLNFYSRWFEDKEAHICLQKSLQNFKAKIQQTFTNADDYKGTAAMERITKIEHEVPLSFVLKIPIFSGGDKKSFKVDICVNVRDGGIAFWLESTELHELMSNLTDEVFDKELERLKAYAIIKKW